MRRAQSSFHGEGLDMSTPKKLLHGVQMEKHMVLPLARFRIKRLVVTLERGQDAGGFPKHSSADAELEEHPEGPNCLSEEVKRLEDCLRHTASVAMAFRQRTEKAEFELRQAKKEVKNTVFKVLSGVRCPEDITHKAREMWKVGVRSAFSALTKHFEK